MEVTVDQTFGFRSEVSIDITEDRSRSFAADREGGSIKDMEFAGHDLAFSFGNCFRRTRSTSLAQFRDHDGLVFITCCPVGNDVAAVQPVL